MTRIADRFAKLKDENRAAFVSYVMAGDPGYETSLDLVKGLPEAGVDIIELGFPFTDPMADGPAIQLAGQRSLRGGQTLTKTLDLVRAFRGGDAETPIVLMGYYNPVATYGVARFIADAKEAGVDGLIVVDLPPEEDEELCTPAMEAGLDFIRLTTPTTDEKRLPTVIAQSSGFIYYVSITGVTGSASADADAVGQAVARLKKSTDLPVGVGFGVKTPEAAAEIAKVADAVVVGSAIVGEVAKRLDSEGKPTADCITATLAFVRQLADGVKGARA